jgi:hypothetical protein
MIRSCGERGIRTPGPPEGGQRFSRPPHSTTLPSLLIALAAFGYGVYHACGVTISPKNPPPPLPGGDLPTGTLRPEPLGVGDKSNKYLFLKSHSIVLITSF